jgi:3-hydroxyacyl-[acyl-carrier-protein] dehydratase
MSRSGPLALVDEVVELEPGLRALVRTTLEPGHPVLEGHFPGHPVLPGVLVLEALAQTGCVALGGEAREGSLAHVARARFRRQVRPGDTMLLEARVLAGAARVEGTARVEGRAACQAVIGVRYPPAR